LRCSTHHHGDDMATILRCTDCGIIERNAILTDAMRSVAVAHERWHADQDEAPSQYALRCPTCSWFYEPRTIIMVKRADLRALILDQHKKVCVGATATPLRGVERSRGRPDVDGAAAHGGRTVPARASNSPQRRAG
jgi:hypothetical protein